MTPFGRNSVLRGLLGSLACVVVLPWADPQAQAAEGAVDRLRPAPTGTVQLGGWLGAKLEVCLTARVMAQDIGRIVRPYMERAEYDAGHWRCEYWGKWYTSAALGYQYQPTPAHGAKLDESVDALLASQTPDGYIGTYRDDSHLEVWDVWGRKYTLLGLLAHYDVTGDERALIAARRVADHLLEEAPVGKYNLTENGIDVLKGLPPSSLLEPLALLYQRTRDQRYLALATDIVANWNRPNKFFAEGHQLVEHALAGTPPHLIGSRKAYEMMSCFEGLCEFYRISGNPAHLAAAQRFAETIARTELMAHGSASNQELWCDGARVQTEILEQPTETCVTATWMKLCFQLLRLTGDPRWADELELSLYNALVASMTPDGQWWAYFSPLAGQRVPSHYQHDDVEMSCCVANGPRALLLAPRWCVMGADDGLRLNLYAPGESRQQLRDGGQVRLSIETDYPQNGLVRITVTPDQPRQFTLGLRIPRWSEQTRCRVGAEDIDCTSGAYALIDRTWSPGDVVELEFDLRGRVISAPTGAPQCAVMWGPILLALDNRLVAAQDVAVRLAADSKGHVALKRVTPPPGVWLAFEAPFEVRPSHYFDHYETRLTMCDYASAGNQWSSDNLFRVWLPQPLFLREPYPRETWRLMCPKLDVCPSVPDSTSTVAAPPFPVQITGDWTLTATVPGSTERPQAVRLSVDRPEPVRTNDVSAELPPWEPSQPGWARRRLSSLSEGDSSARFALVPESVRVFAEDSEIDEQYQRGTDFEVDYEWGAVGRLVTGRITADQAVRIEYSYLRRRLDSVVQTDIGQLVVRRGTPHLATPRPPDLESGEVRLANVWLPAHTSQLTQDHLFPVLEESFPESPLTGAKPVERYCKRTLARLRNGESLRILAWGDSVTEGYLGEDQWQVKFVRRLRERYPASDIELTTVGWGAHNSHDFLEAPPGHPRNYAEHVLGARPDLIVSEFVNDVPQPLDVVAVDYARILADLRRREIDWIIIAPHYTSFMNLESEHHVDEDPRPYVQWLYQFGRSNDVAVADAAARYGRLWRQGLPFTTLMLNTANHPDARGMTLFADALMALFPPESSQ